MQTDKYSAVSDDAHRTYEFLSEGSKGTIKKVVLYQPVGSNIFNPAFGDWDEIAQEIKDSTRSNNQDRDKVLATVAFTAIDFISFHPAAIILVTGITPAKTRLYQMGINSNWQIISKIFDISGFKNGSWESLRNDKNYDSFSLKAK